MVESISMNDIEKFLKKNKKNRIKCPAMKAEISKDQCNRNQNNAREKKSGAFGDKLNRFIVHCSECKKGSRYFKELKKPRTQRQKQCTMDKHFPDKCSGPGIITEDTNRPPYIFEHKEFCSEECSKKGNWPFFKKYTKKAKVYGMRVA